MASPYKRRRHSLVRNLWVYRRVVVLAVVLGLILWFVLTNNEKVEIAFPFRLGSLQSTTGLVILASALVGSLATALVLGVVLAFRRARSLRAEPESADRPPLVDELPPTDYAAKTGEGFRDSRWS